jgi:hypothetical protein
MAILRESVYLAKGDTTEIKKSRLSGLAKGDTTEIKKS